jgi:hypothetical protein
MVAVASMPTVRDPGRDRLKVNGGAADKAHMPAVAELSDLDALAIELAQLERREPEISAERRALHGRIDELRAQLAPIPSANGATADMKAAVAVVDVVLERGHLMIWQVLGGSWRVAYDDFDDTAQRLVPLLENALGKGNSGDVFRYGIRAMEAANAASSLRAVSS